MKKFGKRIVTLAMMLCMIFSTSTTSYAEEQKVENDPEPIIIGQYDGLLSECLDENETLPLSEVVNVRINSYATYDSKNGVQVKVKLYVPITEYPKPKFTAMVGTVSVLLNNKTTNTSFSKASAQKETIESDVNTGRTGKSDDKGTVAVSGTAYATNALSGGGVFSISYPITIP